MVDTLDENGQPVRKLVDTTVGRIIFNQVVPKEVGFLNEVLTKRSLRDIIGLVMKKAGADKTAAFLDDIKHMGYQMAFRGGLSFNLDAVIIPDEKEALVNEGYERVEEVMESYNMGLITNNERYNQIIDIWTNINMKATKTVLDHLTKDMQGFNPVYMMLDSGARGSKEQIRQPLRDARFDGQAAEIRGRRRSGHRKPDPVELQGGAFGVGIFHLYARRP